MPLNVMAGLVPAIHDLQTMHLEESKSWVPAPRAGMTSGEWVINPHLFMRAKTVSD